MGHESTARHRRAARAALGICALAVSLLAAPTAQAVPFHARKASLDVTGLNHACGAAVDSKGDFYASSAGTSEVKVFNEAHTLLTSIEDSHEPCGLALTTAGNLYVSERATENVVRFHPNEYPPTGATTYTETTIDASGKAKGIAVDPTDNRLYVAEGSKVALYSSAGSFEANLGEGTLSEATGVAAFSYLNALPNKASSQTEHFLWVADPKGVLTDRLDLFRSQDANVPTLSRELDGTTTPDGSFTFGTAGASLAEDPGNRNTAGECKVVGEPQACTAGHLFLYDKAHKALDEFDASGGYLDQTKNAAFADAEPSAIAIDRSGGANDGTLYLTAGPGAGAKALAFGPLKAPKREALKLASEGGLSQKLSSAQSVAVDSHGDVYAATATASKSIRIYSPSGAEITSITDAHKPGAVAVDSTGHVYVVDVNNSGFEESEATYYTPSEYPPKSTTTYTRRTEPILTALKCPEVGGGRVRAIAVNPGPGAGKDHLLVICGNEFIRIYDSAAHGSTLINGEFGNGLMGGKIRESLAVSGATGTVYVGENLHVITAIDEATEKLVGRFEDTGFTSGAFGANPQLGLDQSSGHLVEFDEKNHSAREYDAASGFVAEFGNFTEGLTEPAGIAVDNACALHEPEPLTGQACKEYDPANGTAYVAFADTHTQLPSPSPPYKGVNAFAPLSYPAPSKHKLTLEKKGTGPGTVTSQPAGINCGTTCEAEFLETEVVKLTETPGANSEFKGWTGCEAQPSASECEVTMSEDRTVTAEFEPEAARKFPLTLIKAGTGQGTVTSSPAGIACGLACPEESAEFPAEAIILSASPASGSEFAGWGLGECESEPEPGKCVLTTSSAKTVHATFNPIPRTLTINETGSGTGTVECKFGAGSFGACTSPQPNGTAVEVKATASGGSELASLSGTGSASSCSASPCSFTLEADSAVTAEFNLEPPSGPTNRRTLTLTKNANGPGGLGTVSSKPKGIKCAVNCSEALARMYKATPVTLTEKPGKNSTFSHWTGACSGSAPTCTVPMADDESVGAVFALSGVTSEKTLNPPEELTLSKGEGSGFGTVKAPGLGCEAECSQTTVLYQGPPRAKAVILKEAPAFGSAFSGWSGGCTPISETECEAKMETAKSVTGEFEALPNKTLRIDKSYSSGNGTVSSKPKGIKCAATCTQAVAQMPEGASVELSAKPGKETTLVEWTGACASAGSSPTCTVTMSADKEAGAVFSKPSKTILEGAEETLTLNKAGTGFGTVKAPGLACEALCSSTVVLYQGPVVLPHEKPGKLVILKAASAPGSGAVAWSGCKEEIEPEPGNVECVVEMDEGHTITAAFDELQ